MEKTAGKTSDRNIFLIGFMGSGKSTVAAGLERLLGMKRVEMDQQIVKTQGMEITEIFARYGEEFFRDLESRVTEELSRERGRVVSCGGGVVLRQANVERMKENGSIVLLKARPETIYERVKDSTERPILNADMSVAHIRELMEKRSALYEAAADLAVDTDGRSAEEICREIADRL